MIECKVLLNDFDKIKNFARKVYSYKADINIGYFDAKSIMAIFAMDTSHYVIVTMVNGEKNEEEKFIKDMEEFE